MFVLTSFWILPLVLYNDKNTAKLYGDALVWTTVLIDWLDWVFWIDLGSSISQIILVGVQQIQNMQNATIIQDGVQIQIAQR